MLCSPPDVGLIHNVYTLAMYMLSSVNWSYLRFSIDKVKARSVPDHRLASRTVVAESRQHAAQSARGWPRTYIGHIYAVLVKMDTFELQQRQGQGT